LEFVRRTMFDPGWSRIKEGSCPILWE